MRKYFVQPAPISAAGNRTPFPLPRLFTKALAQMLDGLDDYDDQDDDDEEEEEAPDTRAKGKRVLLFL